MFLEELGGEILFVLGRGVGICCFLLLVSFERIYDGKVRGSNVFRHHHRR